MTRAFLAVLFLVALTGCAASIRGAVVEQGTEKPIPGAIVYAQWMLYGSGAGVDSRTSCVQVDFATTDSNGRFELPGVAGNVRPLLGVYKPGYEEFVKGDGYGNVVPHKAPAGEKWLVMKTFEGTTKERLEYLSKQRGKECGKRENYVKKLVPFYQALYKEANSIAIGPGDKKKAKEFLYALDILELGYEEAEKKLMKGGYR